MVDATALEENDWYYDYNGDRKGPLSYSEMIELLKNETISPLTLVWNKSWGETKGWNELNKTSLFRAFSNDGPPPLPTTHINNSFAWGLVAVPILGAFFEIILQEKFGLSEGMWLFLAYALVNSLLAIIDAKRIKESGHSSKLGFWFWLIPVYLFKRARALKHSLNYFWAWVGAFIVSFFIIGLAESRDFHLGMNTPSCSSNSIVDLSMQVFGDIPQARIQGVRALGMTGIEQIDSYGDVRICEANLRSSEGISYNVVYSITPQGNQYYVELEVIGQSY